ncbi:MAG: hypothetical protein IJM65_01495 [Bacteroidales bacterium]|nr:hypothetical protein [Bacteroidales bacterium]
MKKLLVWVMLCACCPVFSQRGNPAVTRSGCDSALNGIYYVGDSLSDFLSVEEAVSCLMRCGVSGPVELRIRNGLFYGFSICGIIPGSSVRNTVTFRSGSGCRDSVRFVRGNALELANTAYLVFRDITFDGQLSGVKIDSNLTDVEFRHCRIVAPVSNQNIYSAVSYTGVPNSEYMLDNVRFVDNIIEGGAQNFYLYYACGSGSAMSYSRGVTIDSNTLCEAFNCGLRTYYFAMVSSFSHNRVTPNSGAISFQGIFAQYGSCWHNVEGNRIRIQTSGNAYGMYFMDIYSETNRDTLRISNNEILVSGKSATYGISCQHIRLPMFLVHNTVFTQSAATAYGFNTTVHSPRIYPVIRNNILANSGNDGFPLYISDGYHDLYGSLYKFDRDYNNYYSDGAWIAYMNGNLASMADLRKADTGCDHHSLSVAPDWRDSGSLEINNSVRFTCPVCCGVDKDINGFLRIRRTAMGCHMLKPDSADAMLEAFADMERLISSGYAPMKVVVRNMGVKPIRKATIRLVIDRTSCPEFTYRPAVPLAFQQADTISIGSFQLSDGLHDFMAVIHVEGDTNALNDSIFHSRVICDRPLAGTYVMGNSAGADFSFDDFDGVLRRIRECGVSGDITIALEDGTYRGSMYISSIGKAMGSHRLTLTSLSDERNSVVVADSGTVLTIGHDIHGFTLKNMGLQLLSQSGSVVQLNNGCGDIDILHNNLLCDTVGKGKSKCYGISTYNEYLPDNGCCHNICIAGNLIRGGYAGVIVSGLASNIVCKNVMVDHNEISGQCNAPVSLYAVHLASCSHNRLASRFANTDSLAFCGMELQWVQADSIVGNLIDIRHRHAMYATRTYGMSLNYLNRYGGRGSALIANNCIRMYQGYGVRSTSNRLCFFHNTVRVSGEGAVCGYRHSGDSRGMTVLRGNVIDVLQAPALDFNGDGNSDDLGFVSDYNNFCNHGGNVILRKNGKGYASISDFQNYLETDTHSVSVVPIYSDTSNVLDLRMDGRILLLRTDAVKDDIHEKGRVLLTTMGANQAMPLPNGAMDAALYDFAGTALQSDASVPVCVTLHNLSADTLTEATIRWSANGVRQADFKWRGRLGFGGCDTVTIGSHTAGAFTRNRLVAWVEKPNLSDDADHSNDTAILDKFVCGGTLAAGSYTVGGEKADFDDPEVMKDALYHCGVAGPVVMRLRSGNYGALRLSDTIPGTSVTNMVTLQAEEGAQVVFEPLKDGAALLCINLPFVTFRGLSFGDSASGTIGVKLEKNCSYLTFRCCNIYACSTSTDKSCRAFVFGDEYASSNLKKYSLDNLRLVGNNIKGGYHNIYLAYAAGNDSNAIPSAIIDSNRLTYAYYAGIYTAYYGNYPSISHNTIISRHGFTGIPGYSPNSNTYYGLYTNYYRGMDTIDGNRLYVCSHTTGWGLYLHCVKYSFDSGDDYDTVSTIVTNNEVRVSGGYGSCKKYGIYLSGGHTRVELHHNSVLVYNTGIAYAMYLSTIGTGTRSNMSRNLFCADGVVSGYALYIQDSAYGPALGLRSWNNLVSSNYAANVCGKNFGLEEFVRFTRQDSHSLSVTPQFVDTAVGLEIGNHEELACPSLHLVPRDINVFFRPSTTTIGCHTVIDSSQLDIVVPERDSLQSAGINVYGYGREIFIIGAAGRTAWVYNTAGQIVCRVECGDSQRLAMPVQGVYFVRVGRFAPKKVLVY